MDLRDSFYMVQSLLTLIISNNFVLVRASILLNAHIIHENRKKKSLTVAWWLVSERVSRLLQNKFEWSKHPVISSSVSGNLFLTGEVKGELLLGFELTGGCWQPKYLLFTTAVGRNASQHAQFYPVLEWSI